MLRAVVIGHGDFATGLVSAVRGICGLEERFVTLSNQDFDAQTLEERLRSEIAGGIRVIFTDLAAGSAATAARRVIRDSPNVMIVTGTNLAMLLDYALSRSGDPIAAAHAAIEKGRRSLDSIGPA